MWKHKRLQSHFKYTGSMKRKISHVIIQPKFSTLKVLWLLTEQAEVKRDITLVATK